MAQNANDQAETVLFRILRGTSVDGLAGIAFKRFEENVPVVRPLLNITRAEIERYCEENNLEPRRDLTNDEPIYTRNKIRLDIIPELEKLNPNIVSTLNRLAESASADKEYLYEVSNEAYRDVLLEEGETDPDTGDVCYIKLDNKKLKTLHTAIRYRVYNLAATKVGMKENMARVYLESIDKVSDSLNGKAYTELNGGFRVKRETNKLVFFKEN